MTPHIQKSSATRGRRLLVTAFAAGMGMLVTGTTGTAAPVRIDPSADAFLAANSPGNNYGGAGALLVSGSDPGLTKGVFLSLMKFDFSATKASLDSTYGVGNWTVQSATLQLTNANPNNALFNNTPQSGSIAVTWFSDDSWVEGAGTPAATSTTGVTYTSDLSRANAGSDQSMGDSSVGTAITGTTSPSLTLSAGFLSDLSSGSLASIRFTAGTSTVNYAFNSANNPTTANRPFLRLDVVPEPGAGGVMLLAAGVGTLSRRRKRGNR